MKFTLEIAAGLVGFAGWFLFFWQTKNYSRLWRELEREKREASELWHVKIDLEAANNELEGLAAHWRRAAWFGVACVWIILIVEFYKRWKARK